MQPNNNQPTGPFFPQQQPQQNPQTPQNGQPWDSGQAVQQQPQDLPVPPPDMQGVNRLTQQLEATKQQLSGVAENGEAAMLHQAYAQAAVEALQPSTEQPVEQYDPTTPSVTPQTVVPGQQPVLVAPQAQPAPMTSPPADPSQPVSTGAEGELIIRPQQTQQPQQQPPQQPNGNGNWNGDNNGNSN
jgi:hypothetical protein